MAWLPCVAVLCGCDQLGIESPAKAAEKVAAQAKAVGSACRHAQRAIEDCYNLNPKSEKSSIYTGWREMDEYMRENKLEGIVPVVPRPEPKKPKPSVDPDNEEESSEPADASSAASAH